MEDKLINLEYLSIDNKALKYIPVNIALKYKILPFIIKNNRVYIATDNDFTPNDLEEIKFICKKDVRIFKVNEKEGDITNYIYKYYNKEEVKGAFTTFKNIYDSDKYKHTRLLQNHSEISPVQKINNYIITEAILKKSSDIHIEPLEKQVGIRFRIDGVLHLVQRIPYNVYFNLIGRIKILCNMDTTEKRIPQDGKFTYKFKNRKYDLRVSTLPTINGEKVAIRILYKSNEFKNISSLGFNDDIHKHIKSIIKKQHGIFLITGPTGSGKSTTLYAILNEMDKDHKNIVTLEDPVEYSIDGINQVNINPKIGLTFSLGLKNIVRQDPDVIMIGEIRDEETAKMAIRAAITGHLVLATMHTNDAPSAILRLIDMGIPKYLLADAIIGVMAQRLVRKLCPYCRKQLNQDNFEIRYSSKGCDKCHEGYLGRIVVCEFMNFTEKHRKMIINNFDINSFRKYSIENGMKPLKTNGMELAKKGITSIEEIINI